METGTLFRHVLPLSVCVASGLLLMFTPTIIWLAGTGHWMFLQQPEINYYLQIAAEAYYNHPWYLRDPVVHDGLTIYTWLPFVPAILVAKALGLSVFSIGTMWAAFASAGTALGLYLVFWRFLGSRWLAAGLSIFCLANYGFARPDPLFSQFAILIRGLILDPHGTLQIFQLPHWHWRIPDPALDLPFLFAHLIAVSIARERDNRAAVACSGISFGVLFYVYFYAWTMAAGALCIAFVFDRAGRRVYAETLLIGAILGLPQLAIYFQVHRLVPLDAMARVGFLGGTEVSGRALLHVSPLIVLLAGLWILSMRRTELIYLWSMFCAGLILALSHLATGVFIHDYHWQWLYWPIRLVLILTIGASVVKYMNVTRSARWAFAGFVVLYLISGIYVAAAGAARNANGILQMETFRKYAEQRMQASTAPLDAGAVVAGDVGFCDLASIAENQRALVVSDLPVSMAMTNSDWQYRIALNAYLEGIDEPTYNRLVATQVKIIYNGSKIQVAAAEQRFVASYHEVENDPGRFFGAYDVRYVAIPDSGGPPLYRHSDWRLVQPGPSWQIWELPR